MVLTTALLLVITSFGTIGVPSEAEPAHAHCRPFTAHAPPVGVTACPGVRPGAFVEVPATNTTCTLGFLLRDRSGRSYMTTAGHCAAAEGTKRIWKRSTGPRAYGSDGRAIGAFSFVEIRGTRDFGLILLDSSIRPNPQVCHFGGPTGLNLQRSNDPAVVQFYGQAEVLSMAAPARSGIVRHTRDPDLVYAQAPIYLGDSGGPWLTADGRALGYLTHIVGYAGVPSADTGTALVRRLGPPVAAAEVALKTKLSLVTAAPL